MFAEDLSPFFDVARGFAVTATRTPAGGGDSADGAVIFDLNGLDVADFGVVTDEPSFIVPASTFVGLAEDDTFEIQGDGFVARSVMRVRDGAISLVTLART